MPLPPRKLPILVEPTCRSVRPIHGLDPCKCLAGNLGAARVEWGLPLAAHSCGIYQDVSALSRLVASLACTDSPASSTMSRELFEGSDAIVQAGAEAVAWPSIKPYRNSSTGRSVLHVMIHGSNSRIVPLRPAAQLSTNDSRPQVPPSWSSTTPSKSLYARERVPHCRLPASVCLLACLLDCIAYDYLEPRHYLIPQFYNY